MTAIHTVLLSELVLLPPGEVAMRANMVYLTPSSQYIDSREAWISAAMDLGHDAATVEAVWDACGVVPPPPPCDNPFLQKTLRPGHLLAGPSYTTAGNCDWDSNANNITNENTERPNNTGGSGNCADADSDVCGEGTQMDTELRTPLIDLSAVTSATLEFKSEYLDYIFSPVDLARVDISTDGGFSWTNLLTWEENHLGPDTVQLDLTPYVGSSSTIIRFHYVAGWDWWWEIDDVSICGDGGGDGGGGNAAPVAQDDTFTVNEDTANTTLAVLLDNGNGPDSDLDGDPLNIVSVGLPDQGGTATINDNGTPAIQPMMYLLTTRQLRTLWGLRPSLTPLQTVC